MKNKKIIYKNTIHKKYLNSKVIKKLNNEFKENIKIIINNLDEVKNVFHSLSKKYKFNFKTKDINKFKKYKTIVIIGMGGSILGSEAIYFFLKEKIKKNFLFLNDIDENKIRSLKKKNLSKLLFVIISKSGNTIETLSNFLALKIVKKNSKNIIIISEKNKNSLYSLSKKMNIKHIEHKDYIGGRYSVLSEVGIVPAHLMGLNINKLRQNIISHFKARRNKFLRDSTTKLANLFIKKKIRNIILFNYAPKLDKFLCWNQQLIAESLGKKGKGFLPIISKAPKDHHSLLQLYLDGPRDKIFYIFSVDDNSSTKINSKILDKEQNFLNNKSLNQIKIAQKNSFIKVLKKNKIPFREFKIRHANEQSLGELFSYFILETAIIGKLTGINPFDQPAVEQVKTITKKLLA